MSNELVSLSKNGEVGIITVNNPPVNALSPGVPEGIRDCIENAKQDNTIKAIVLIGAGRTFIAGADIREFAKIRSGERKVEPGSGHKNFLHIEDCPKPIIAAIHGTALGGGLEFALACHYRVAVPSAQVGQPEVKLGIIPGGEGTQRLPRLTGLPKALEMCVGGDPIPATQAYELGLVDRLIEGDLLEGAAAFAREVIADGARIRKTRELTDKLGNEAVNVPIFTQARDTAKKAARGQIAPLKAIDAIEAATRLPFDQGCEREAELFQECLKSTQSASLIHVFFGERAVAKVPDVPADTPIKEIKRAAVIGAGTMGGGITMSYVNAGIPVVLRESEQQFLDRGIATIRKNYEISMKRGKLTPEQVEQRMAMITPTLTYDGFSNADIVVEAVFENMDLKKKVFSELDKVCKPDAILASNTSTLNVDEIAAMTSRPDHVIGHHFFSPANVMRLLEIVRGKETSKETIATSMALAKKLKKVGVLVGNCWGFVGNRMVGPYTRESQFLLEEGARVQDVDSALYEFGMAMGPFAMSDLAGVDVGWRVKEERKHMMPAGERTSKIVDRLYELGRYGQKTGSGYYKYEAGNRTPIPDAEVEKIIEECAKESGISRRTVSAEEIIDRTMYALVNEGARILEEGIALRAVDIDIIYAFGYGFPAHRGGPMWYADTVGLKRVYEKVLEFERQHGKMWSPAPLLKRLAEQGRSFADLDKGK
ncbi:MAG TPA: 3-hydroxyacyl-CoA dehydrogenase NAD-binding domain-containing protein [Blastocatellia bacterium]|nr:3-hydroxyacyl-CoA dehydrogenase NAD-binding domain-containing protein [Blastocatellia bacterium]